MSDSKIRRKKKKLSPHTISAVKEIADNVFIIEFNKIFTFHPGQIVAVSNKIDDDSPRLYSIASGVDELVFRILFDINPNGYLTPALAKMKAGEILYVSEPFGKFTGTDSPAFWIATGTGIAPFISMALSTNKTENKTLWHGARTIQQFYFQDLLKNKLLDRYKRFCTQEKGPDITEGRLTQYLLEEKLSKDIKYYLCGNPDMIIAVREILVEEKEIPIENIITEIFF